MISFENSILVSLITGGVTVLASSGFWNMRIKKMELRYAEMNQNDAIEEKLDALIKGVEDMHESLNDLKEESEKSDALLIAVARDRIFHLCKKFTSEKDTDPDNMRDIVALLDPYKAKGGDGLADEYFDAYRQMFRTHGGEK